MYTVQVLLPWFATTEKNVPQAVGVEFETPPFVVYQQELGLVSTNVLPISLLCKASSGDISWVSGIFDLSIVSWANDIRVKQKTQTIRVRKVKDVFIGQCIDVTKLAKTQSNLRLYDLGVSIEL